MDELRKMNIDIINQSNNLKESSTKENNKDMVYFLKRWFLILRFG